MEESNPSPEHEDLLAAHINTYVADGYIIVAADDGEHEVPGKIGRHAPDIIAKRNNAYRICEVEVGLDEFKGETTVEQFEDFSKAAEKGGYLFDIVVPKAQLTNVKEVLKELGLKDEARSIGNHIQLWTD